MRTAGVRLRDGRALWVDAADRAMSPLDEAIVRLHDGDCTGYVFVTPEQLLRAPEPIEGLIVAVWRRGEDPQECLDLPGSDMPPLGSQVEIGGARGTVNALDPVGRTVRVTRPHDDPLEAAAEEIVLLE